MQTINRTCKTVCDNHMYHLKQKLWKQWWSFGGLLEKTISGPKQSRKHLHICWRNKKKKTPGTQKANHTPSRPKTSWCGPANRPKDPSQHPQLQLGKVYASRCAWEARRLLHFGFWPFLNRLFLVSKWKTQQLADQVLHNAPTDKFWFSAFRSNGPIMSWCVRRFDLFSSKAQRSERSHKIGFHGTLDLYTLNAPQGDKANNIVCKHNTKPWSTKRKNLCKWITWNLTGFCNLHVLQPRQHINDHEK